MTLILTILIIIILLILVLFLNKKETFYSEYESDDIHGPMRDASYKDLLERIDLLY